MNHYYRYETDSEERWNFLRKFLIRNHIEFTAGFGERKLFRTLPEGTLYQREPKERYWVQMFCEEDQAELANAWLARH